MKIDFGCGPKCLDEYVGCDIRDLPGVVYNCPSWLIHTKVPYNTVTNIHSRHFLEHLDIKELHGTLRSWYAIMAPGGIGEAMVPDIAYHAWQLLPENRNLPAEINGKMKNWVHGHAGLYGWQRGTWDIHKTGFDLESLTHELNRVGFVRIERCDSDPWNLHVTFEKP